MLNIADTHFSFRLRLIFEADGDDAHSPPLLRGSLQRLDNDQVRYFSSFAEIPALLCELTSGTQETAGWTLSDD